MSFCIDSLVGVMTSASSLFCVQPFYALKTSRQNQFPITLSPKFLWGGYLSNATGDALSFTTQYLIFKNKDKLPINHSIIGGIFGGLIANSSEQFMDKHRFYKSQNQVWHYKDTLLKIKNTIGTRFFVRGLQGTMTREITYNYVWTTGASRVEETIQKRLELSHPFLSKIASSLASGVILTVINHPFDTYKSKIHNDAEFGYLRKNGFSALKSDLKSTGINTTLKSLFKESYKGAVFRSGIISVSLLLNQPLIKTYHKIFDETFT